jgi:type III restriction enzyme
MALTLKNYQQTALAALESFFEKVRGAITEPQVADAFRRARAEALGSGAPRTLYRRFSAAQEAVPHVCVRIPTGGGKTLLAAHAIERAARLYVGTRYPVALWLVPSNTIRTQTIDALKAPGHPYREALEQYFPSDRLRVVDIDECDALYPDDFDTRAIVVVTTIQALRIGNTASRNVYAYKEVFEPHFKRVQEQGFFETVGENDLAEQPYLTTADIGRTKYSLANLLAYYQPIVIVDEAHNATTSLSIETLGRLRPACIIEWTATPAPEQNVLFTVSAEELKAEHMIKLPIALRGHPNWQDAVRDAVLTRERLGKEAAAEAEYIRPIVLFQADSREGAVPVEKLREHLVTVAHIDQTRIAIATGNQRELDGINLFDPACPIDFVITVEALKEGWDCSFAYVFCTVQNIRSAKDMEQLLGRVLRLPYASPRASEHLNRAYAHVAMAATLETANRLAERLIAMGFEEMEALAAIEPTDDLFGDRSGPRPPPSPIVTTLPQPLTLEAAEQVISAAGAAATLTPVGDKYEVRLTGVLPPDAIEHIVKAVPRASREDVQRDLKHHQAPALVTASPKQRGAVFAPVPRLLLPVQGELLLYEPELVAELANLSLAGCDATLPGFGIKADAPGYLIDVDGDRVRISQEADSQQLDLNVVPSGVRREDVILSLDQRLNRSDILQADMIAWLGRAIDELQRQGIELTAVVRHMNTVADALNAKLKSLIAAARQSAFQLTLTEVDPARKPTTDPAREFRFPDIYPARTRYNGRYQFKKHWNGPPGDLDDDIEAEETACAIALDQMSDVKHWIRNLERHPEASFWLPTSTDRFYPDFVAELVDGRILIVEYKGAHLLGGTDTTEKFDIASVWALATAGRGGFVLITDAAHAAGRTPSEQLRAAIQS